MLSSPGPGFEPSLLVWPTSYEPLEDGSGVRGDGVEVHVGDAVSFGGASYSQGEEDFVAERLVGPPIKEECVTGRYGLVTSMPSD